MSEAASVQDVLGAAGTPPEFVWREKTYQLGFLTQAVKARYEQMVVSAERDAVKALERMLGAKEYADRVDAFGRKVRDREYRTGGTLWHLYTFGTEQATGFVLFLAALFQEHHPEVTPAVVKEMLEDDPRFLLFAADQAVPGFFEMAAGSLKGADLAALKPAVEAWQQVLRQTAARTAKSQAPLI
jgi:hypothetical protein